MTEKAKPRQARCLYEILGLPRDCTQEQIRSSYKRLALQLHPDKLISSGTVSEEEATSAFQSLLNAYQVLSDPRERAFYDSHRSQILFSDPNSSSSSSSPFGGPHIDVPHLFPFFSNSAYSSFSDTGKGFYKVYADIFDRIYAQELSFAKELELGPDAVGQAPSMGNLDSPYAQVSAFYGFWLGFSTVMDFSWVDPYRSSAGPTRKARRVMEDENRKARKKARKEFNEMVRSLAEFVKKRDKRVIEMQMKRNLEEEKKRAEEKERKKEEARKKMEKARLYEEPEWARVAEEEDEEEIADDVFDDGKKKGEKELYCVVCSKKFKSEKQWKNHEQSKKHREKVAELRDSYKAEEVDEDGEEEEEEEVLGNGQDAGHVGFGSDVQADDNVYDLCAKFKVGVDFRKERSRFRSSTRDQKGQEEGNDSFGSDEEESILEAMVSGHRNRKNTNASQPKPSPMSRSNVYGDDKDELGSMEYDTRKINRRNRVSKKAGGTKSSAEDPRVEVDVPEKQVKSSSIDSEVLVDEYNADDVSPLPESSSHSIEEIGVEEIGANSVGDQTLKKNRKVNNQSVDRKLEGQREANIKSRNTSKGKKQKATSKTSSHSCEMCGEDFESRNKLHIHLGATGHAVLKSR
ncbi:DNAJ protein JJJ1 homolog [Magnolia sinica]|uniref:DNAJ protein JJJ1 homolog n=1 Tax=Magnolia sinica TaxID=86752 RepID=UPI002658B870|nr:DNAJ protein JJJ1 homolog [Magnolia sinica]